MEWRRAFSESEIRQFAELSGDKGVHHLEPDAQGRLMAHGLLTASLPTKLGGDLNYIARTMRFDFLRPVYAGEELCCTGIVDTVAPGPRGRLDVAFSFTVTNPKGKRVLEGTSSGVILRVALALLMLFGGAGASRAATQRALVLGDSHTVSLFGKALVSGLVGQGWKTTVYAVCGASVTWWIHGEGDNYCGWWFRSEDGSEERGKWRGDEDPPPAPHRQAQLLNDLRPAAPKTPPDLVIVALGANRDGNFVAVGTDLLKNRIAPSSRCFWVRPPPVPHRSCASYDRTHFEADFETIKRQAGRDCELIDSRRFLDVSWSDGCHYGNDCGTVWGQRSAEQITGALPGFGASAFPNCAQPKPRRSPRRKGH